MSALVLLDELILECPLCFENFKKNRKIFQCQNGHAYCDECYKSFIWSKKKVCPICTVDIHDKIRNTLAEDLAEKSFDSKVGSTVKEDGPKTPGTVKVHDATCDGAHSQLTIIHGQRYKCTQCYDFDLCSKCFKQGLHKEHLFMCLRDEQDTLRFEENAAKTSSSRKPVTRSASNSQGMTIDESLPKRKRKHPGLTNTDYHYY